MTFLAKLWRPSTNTFINIEVPAGDEEEFFDVVAASYAGFIPYCWAFVSKTKQ